MSIKVVIPLVLFLCILYQCHGKKILIYPVDCGFNSRLMNLVKIADILNNNGHNATVLVNNRVAKMLEPQNTTLLIYNVPNVDKLDLITDEKVLNKLKKFTMLGIGTFLEDWIALMMPFCKSVLGTDVLHNLKAEGYDLVIFDNIWDCGRILIEYLDVPSISYSNWGFTLDSYAFYPALPSFVCTAGNEVCNSDKMDFGQRVANVMQWALISYYVMPKVLNIYNRDLRQKYNLNVSTSGYDFIALRSPVIVNGDFVLDYPRPLMPHILMIPGLFHKVSKPLPEEFKSFIEGSSPHGVVIVSFGSMVSKVDEEKAEIFAKVFGELSQRVIWRHTGVIPKSLKNNTKLVSWFPQSDVLRHPLTKMFVTHCGISGTYEAAMNGLPVVAIPLFADQEYNSQKLVARGGMGVRLDFETITEANFREAVTDAISNKTYLRNAEKVSRLLKDEEMPAQKKLLYWVEYTIRHEGAKHLISETALQMNNLVFYSVDVIAFLLALFLFILIVISFVMYFCNKLFCGWLRGKEKLKRL